MTRPFQPAPPVVTAPLFAPLHGRLVDLLRSLGPDDWMRPTAAGAWTVRDVAAHLLDGDLRKLSFHRDGHRPPPPPAPVDDHRSLVAWLDGLNAAWVDAARRLSPAVLVDLLAWTGPQVASFVESLDPSADALFAVAWAGEARSANWMDTGREYTERWHHQQQMRDAVGAPGLVGREWLLPVLDISLRALPFAYEKTGAARPGTVVVEVTGEAGATWSLVGDDAGWHLWIGEARRADARVIVDADTMWRAFFKGLAPGAAVGRARLEGNHALGALALSTLAVMA
jgi:uncharacterized protein (TIGR03083 family)